MNKTEAQNKLEREFCFLDPHYLARIMLIIDQIEPEASKEDEFGPVDLSGIEPDQIHPKVYTSTAKFKQMLQPSKESDRKPHPLAELDEHSGPEFFSEEHKRNWYKQHDRLLLKALAGMIREANERDSRNAGSYPWEHLADVIEEACK